MEEDERRVWLLMAGERQTDDMQDWSRAMTVCIAYQHEGQGSIAHGLTAYREAVSAGKARPPLPPYRVEQKAAVRQQKPRRRIVEDDGEEWKAGMRLDDEDDRTERSRPLAGSRDAHHDSRSASTLTACCSPARDDNGTEETDDTVLTTNASTLES